jgi:gliding motility-associated-like protein
LAGQKQNNQWRFGGGGGIDFNVSPAAFIGGGATQTGEGSASVADRNTGALLFYTDGVTVWNAQNQVMPNGTGLLGGDPVLLSSTTAAVIVPKPGSTTQYYIIAIDEQASTNGVSYSLIDMTLNGGLGDVVASQKNIALIQTNSEKLEVVPSADRQGYWLITHRSNTFYSFKINAAGIQNTPVVSVVGGDHGNGAGHMKVNRQFNKLAMGNFFSRNIELFDFNNTTGVLSNPLIWSSAPTNDVYYGVEFSPNGKLLYVSNFEKIRQYDITLSNPTTIENSKYEIASQGISLQLGPDNKIYANAGSVNVINCPNEKGTACGFQQNVLANQTSGGGYGLHKWVYYFDDIPAPERNEIRSLDSCVGNTSFFTLKNAKDILSVEWDFGDPLSGPANLGLGLFVNHIFSDAGSYNVKAVATTACGQEIVLLNNFTVVNCNSSCIGTIIAPAGSCSGNTLSFRTSPASPISSILWNFGDPSSGSANSSTLREPGHVFATAGTYTVKAAVTFACGTLNLQKTIIITDCAIPCTGAIAATVGTCVEDSTTFSITADSALNRVRWNFGDVGSGADNTSDLNKPAHLFSSAGSFRITAFVDFSCGSDTLEKTISIPECQVSPTTCTLFVPSGFSPNGDGLNDKFKPVCNCTPEVYEWFVYNRWGELLFKSTTTAEQWDGNHKGKNCMPGVYVYRVNYRFPGKPLKQASGNINILR